jgi:protein disulfide-isomerase A1
VIAYIFYDNPELRTNLRRELIPVAKRYRGYVRFVTIDGIEYSHLATFLDVDSSKKDRYPALVVHSLFNDQVFRYDSTSEITTEKVDQFILDILQGKMSSGEKQKTEEQGHDEL